MKSTSRYICLIVLLASLSTSALLCQAQDTGDLPFPVGPNLPGRMNIFYIDNDNDGYGVAAPLGPDVDDNDPHIGSSATLQRQGGSLDELVRNGRYQPRRIFYVAPDGDDQTGQLDRINRPFATISPILRHLLPGDAVVFRAGQYHGNYTLGLRALHGQINLPIVFMAMPGEKVSLEAAKEGITINNCSNIVIDGFIVDGYRATDGGIGIVTHFSQNMTYRNLDVKGWLVGMQAAQDLQHILIEYCVFHDQKGSHGLYLAARDKPNRDITVRNCLFYRNKNGMQHNGRVTNLLLEDNVFHSNWLTGISWLQGVSNSIIRNNLIFNNSTQGIVINQYEDAPNQNIFAYDQTDNLIENNLIWVGRYRHSGLYDPADLPAIVINDASAQKRHNASAVVRRNIIVTYNGPAIRFDPARFAHASTFEQNLIYRHGGDGFIMLSEKARFGYSAISKSGCQTNGNVYGNPNFADVSINYYTRPERFDFTRPSAQDK